MEKALQRRFSILMVTVIIFFALSFKPAMAYDTYLVPDDFMDLEGHWAEVYMAQLVEMGIVNGYEKEVELDGDY